MTVVRTVNYVDENEVQNCAETQVNIERSAHEPQVLKVIVTSRIISFTLLFATHSVLRSVRVSAGVNFAVAIPVVSKRTLEEAGVAAHPRHQR